MNSLKLAVIITLTILLTTVPALASQKVAAEKSLGEKLVRQLWENMQKPDMKMIEKTIAKGFQSVHQFGSNNRAQEMKLIRGLKLGKYTLSNIKITRNGPVIVASYLVSVSETIKGKRLTKKPAPRLSVFLKTHSGWKWIAHANLKPLK
ncbi:MAG: nuclear transport factor 2 family protein [Deltaproteobacteria bacterium]|nr:nuclear transport factor 2 family protein [Deltaproteobacteria bacterium]